MEKDNKIRQLPLEEFQKVVLSVIKDADGNPRLDFLNFLEFENTLRIVESLISTHSLLTSVNDVSTYDKRSTSVWDRTQSTKHLKKINDVYGKLFQCFYPTDTPLPQIDVLSEEFRANPLAFVYQLCAADSMFLLRLEDSFMLPTYRQWVWSTCLTNEIEDISSEEEKEELTVLTRELFTHMNFAATGLIHFLLEKEIDDANTITEVHSLTNSMKNRDVVLLFLSNRSFSKNTNGQRTTFIVSAKEILHEIVTKIGKELSVHGSLSLRQPTKVELEQENLEILYNNATGILQMEPSIPVTSILSLAIRQSTAEPQKTLAFLMDHVKLGVEDLFSVNNREELLVLFEPLFYFILCLFPSLCLDLRHIDSDINVRMARQIAIRLFYASCEYIFALASYSFDKSRKSADLAFSSFLEIFNVISLRAFMK